MTGTVSNGAGGPAERLGVKGVGLALATAVIGTALVVSGCGATTVQGKPVAATATRTTPSGPAIPTFPSSTPSPGSSTTPTQSSTTPDTSTPDDPGPSDPQAVVQSYFDAINKKDYQQAWELGGKNAGKPFSTFAAGFATTDHDTVTVTSVQDNVVTLDLVAQQTDGTRRTYHGTYTVADGIIVHFSVRATG